MRYGFYFDQTRCIGCLTCVIACQDWHDVPAGPASWIRVKTIEKGKYPDLFVTFLFEVCYHCVKPACVLACPMNAITKQEKNGVVIVDSEKCLGKENCSSCYDACPYAVPQFGNEKNAKMQKCDFCADRLAVGKKPICVESCPMQALDAGSIDELRANINDSSDAEGFIFFETLSPSITYKPKQDTRGLVVQRIEITPSSGTDI
jgi:anaerobic dimethyl sulfoxide reductase subunit B (iron-sulfur subunit)